MSKFASRSKIFTGQITVAGSVNDVFELFSPLGEKQWVPGWYPELLHPPGTSWEEGQIFRTQGEMGDAIWVVTRLDRGTHTVRYHRVEPGRYVARIQVHCDASAPDRTEASTFYEFIGLSESGNTEIDALSQKAYDEKMERWDKWINEYLSGRER